MVGLIDNVDESSYVTALDKPVRIKFSILVSVQSE